MDRQKQHLTKIRIKNMKKYILVLPKTYKKNGSTRKFSGKLALKQLKADDQDEMLNKLRMTFKRWFEENEFSFALFDMNLESGPDNLMYLMWNSNNNTIYRCTCICLNLKG